MQLVSGETCLWVTKTEAAAPTQVNVSCASQEALCMPFLSREAITMAKGDGAVDDSNVDDVDDRNESDDEEEEDEENSRDEQKQNLDDETLRRRTGAAAAALLRRKRGGVRPVKPLRNTSVGARRVGSATRSRSNQRSTSKLMDTVRTVASAAAARAESNTNTTAKSSQGEQSERSSSSSTSRVGNNVIQSTIASLLEGQKVDKPSDGDRLSMNARPRSFGILGEEPDPLSHELLKNPMPGTVLLYPTIEHREYRRPSRETLSVRVATPDDDLEIANLRLSVFSDFSNELKSQFCARSCQVLADRRLRGATCVVATCPSGRSEPSEIVVGSVEASVHEFFATKLGQRRPKYSTLYITEVAVSPSARRCGVGSKLMEVSSLLTNLRIIVDYS